MTPSRTPTVGLVLSGGGARAAYQVGVLKAISELLPPVCYNPFPVICGTSAGGLNAAGLACHGDCLQEAVAHLESVWANFRTHQVYRTDWPGVMRCALRFLWTLGFGRMRNDRPVSLLDNQPLREMLARELSLSRIGEIIEAGYLKAVCITASGYTSGESVSFFQGAAHLDGWKRARRLGIKTQIGIDHLLASSAIPLLFPAIHINREYFGDGALRQLAPISPALHLGAEKVLVVGVSSDGEKQQREKTTSYPSIAQVVANILNSSFIDSLEGDIERLMRINRTISHIPEETRSQHINLKHVDVLVISPASKTLDRIAMRHARHLPKSIRTFVRGSGATKRSGSGVLSYLLFEAPYCQELIQLGYEDASMKKNELRAFLHLPTDDENGSGNILVFPKSGATR
jgi:NTE family protein